MKKAMFLRKIRVLLLVFILNSNLSAQNPLLNAFFVSPGNNSCNAGAINAGCVQGNYFDFPVTPGLTLAGLNHLATDYRNFETLPWANFRFNVQIQAPCSLLEIIFEFGYHVTPSPAWINSGNVTAPGNVVLLFYCEEGPLSLSYSAVQALYGSYPITSILLEAAGCHSNLPTTTAFVDNTVINNMTYTYDDCDGDGLLDIYDCNPANNGNNKVFVCHSGQTICVAMPALQAHLDHGDYMGSCQTITRPGIIPAEETSNSELVVSPNPAINQLNVRNNNNKPLGKVFIYDISGKMVYQNFIGASQATIEVKNFSPGIYLLRSNKMDKTIKFVKQ